MIFKCHFYQHFVVVVVKIDVDTFHTDALGSKKGIYGYCGDTHS